MSAFIYLLLQLIYHITVVCVVHEVRSEEIGIVGSRGDPDKQPFLVGYFKSSGRRESKVRQKRDANRKKKSESSNWDYQNNPYTGEFARGRYRVSA